MSFYDNNIISWQSQKQSVVALSTMESEYIALSNATQQTIWLNNLIKEIIQDIHLPIIYCDNQAAIKLSNNNMITRKAKHIDIKYHFIKEKLQNKQLTLKYIPTKDNVADLLTKQPAILRFKIFLLKIDFETDNFTTNTFETDTLERRGVC